MRARSCDSDSCDVQVNFDQKTATVTYDPDKAQPEALTEATANAGYPSTVQK
ncbi:cation transporter [Pseudomonas aeruginosa]|uniref:heavy-metal-associated domain-containing protein n=1 Tax=Pseudomonas aeruginosa TaxID=287 RepID=UPI001049E551